MSNATLSRIKTQVLIIGAGPVGQGMAIEMGQRGIDCMVIDRNERVGMAPRAKTTNVRTREHFRRWGIAGKLAEASPFGIDYPSNVVFATRLSGKLLAKFENALYCAPGRNPLYSEHAQWIPQYRVEQVMRDHLKTLPSASLRLQCQMIDFEQFDDHVLVTVENVVTGERQEIEAQYLAGCDGARSLVREGIGAKLEGTYGLSRNYNFVFRAPGLREAHALGAAIMYWQVNQDMPSIIGPMDKGDLWYFIPTALPPDIKITKEQAADYIRKSTGIDLPYEILSADEWVASKFIASHYRDRRVFLAGDAAHLHPPFGGFGMNMGISDAVDIGWKLAAVLQGWGGPGLLDSYERERRPVHIHVMNEATANHALLGNALVADGMEEDTPEGEAIRQRAGERIRAGKMAEFYTLGTLLGDCYSDSPVIDCQMREQASRDFLNYVPSAEPGCRAPHAWMHDGSSLFDSFGPGFTLLISGLAGEAAAEAAAADAARRGIPLKLIRPEMAAISILYPKPLTLIRPDHHIAWSGVEWSLTLSATESVFNLAAGFRPAIGTALLFDINEETKMTKTSQTPAPVVPVPAKLAHVVLRTSQMMIMRDWYTKVLSARTIYADDGLAFLTYDEEHHRIALLHAPDLKQQDGAAAGVHHIAFTYDQLEGLVQTYERLRELDITPVYCTNHGPTTSLYYRDPDRNQIELQIDNYDTIEEATQFFYSDDFKTNPIGVDFDPEKLVERFRSGEDVASIKRRQIIGARGLDSLPLQ